MEMPSKKNNISKQGQYWRWQGKDINGRRRNMIVGRIKKHHKDGSGISEADAIAEGGNIIALKTARQRNVLRPDHVEHWLRTISNDFRQQLVDFGFIEPAESIPTDLNGYLNHWVSETAESSGDSRKKENAAIRLAACLDGRRSIRDVTLGDAKKFRRWMLKKCPKNVKTLDQLKNPPENRTLGLSENYVRRTTGLLREAFEYAVTHEVISKNPFRDKSLPVVVKANKDRFFYVPQDWTQRILDELPNNEFRLIFVLMRHLSLRNNSEFRTLNWDQVDWTGHRILIHDVKRTSERVPFIEAEVWKYLRIVREEQPDATGRIVPFYSNKHMTQTIKAAVRRAGLKVWPNFNNNLRKNSIIDASKKYPAHVVTEWHGNTESVRNEFYLNITPDDYEAAARLSDASVTHPVTHPEGEQRRTHESGPEDLFSKAKFSAGRSISGNQVERNSRVSGRYWIRTSDLRNVSAAL